MIFIVEGTETSQVQSQQDKSRRIIWGVLSGAIVGLAGAIVEFFGGQNWTNDPDILRLLVGLAVAAFMAAMVFFREWRVFTIVFVVSAAISFFGSFWAIVMVVWAYVGD
jgi:ABC-type enterobactin transport system permease subunit